MAEAKQSLNVFVTGGSENVGLATARALLRRGHKVLATACTAQGALALRLVGALPVYPDLNRASEVLSSLQLAQADAVVHASPQYYGGLPHSSQVPCSEQLLSSTAAVTQAAQAHGVQRIVALSFGYLYAADNGAAKEGDRDARDSDYAAMLAAEALVRDSGLNGFILRSAYIYGGNSAATAVLAQTIRKSQRLPAGDKLASWIHEDDLAAAIVNLLEAEGDIHGVETVNAADDAPRSPEEFAAATCDALGLNAPAFAGAGFLPGLRKKTFRDKLLGRAIVINSGALRERFAWQPRHSSIETGLEATTLTWRMKEAVDADAFYNDYQDKAAEAIASFAYDAVLPEPVAVAESVAAAPAKAEPKLAPEKAAAPAASGGPTPWNEDDAKREERRRKALERKAKRAASQARGS